MEYFKRELSEYRTDINPINNYMSQAVAFVANLKGVDTKEATKLVKKVIRDKGPKDPIVTYRNRLENGDREFTSSKLSEYINSVVRDDDILVPTFTVYSNPKKNKSLHAGFLKHNISRRNKHKAIAFEAYQNGDIDKHTKNDVLQKVMKIFNNSLSGSYASMSTALYNPSQHSTLTSMTRAVASIGNAVTESVVAGNRCLYSAEATINYITAVIDTVNSTKVAAVMSTYNIYYPTAVEVMDMLLYSTKRYWTNPKAEAAILTYLGRLDKYQLAAVMYVNDLHHMKKYNQELIRSFIGGLATKVIGGCNNPLKALQVDTEGVNNLVHHICMEDISGKKIRYKDLVTADPDTLMVLGATAENVYAVLAKYRLLIKTFFTTDILPMDVGNIKDCYRDVIVLSDTDSTCGSYDIWTDWYFGNNKFTPEAVAVSAAVMTINTQVIDHNIRVFAKNMNIAEESIGLLKMKNEYFWSAFVTANVSKHYYANTWIQEGNVYAKPKLELKGVHLIASAGNQSIVTDAHEDMRNLLTTIEAGEVMDPKAILVKVADMERSLLKAIDSGDIAIFKLDKIKDADAYKLDDKSKTPYFHHDIWTKVFADKYGDPGKPTYMTVKIPTVLKSRRLLSLHLDSIEDPDIQSKLREILTSNGKDQLGTYRVPLTIAGGSGIPKEMIQAVDRHRLVLDNMNIYYIQLETMGLFRPQKLLFSEMGY
ncbi:MAG: hypothetical protein Q9M11_03400 [Mariprofundaceae bacterium]|nr:hypothetical protein [Mariprofundaceae bacterium]